MKKWLKWVLGIIVIIILIFIIMAVRAWYSISILKGTGGVSSNTQTVPAVQKQPDSLTTGENDWPCWLGPDGDKRSTQTGIITDWSNGLKSLWQIDYLCQGSTEAAWSAPAIQGNRLVISGRDSTSDLVFCLDPGTGSLIWKNGYIANAQNNHGTGPRATPAIDGDRVYTFGRSGYLACWNLFDGSLIWKQNVGNVGGVEPTWGHSSSPLIDGNLVLVQGGGPSVIVAYDKMTGKVVWTCGKGVAGYAALCTTRLGGFNAILCFHGKGLMAAGMDGTKLWNMPWKTDYDVNATTPLVVDKNHIFISSGYGYGGALLKCSATSADTAWYTADFAAMHTDPYLINGYIYGYSGQSFQNRGAFKCLDTRDGSVKWSTNDMGWGTCLYVQGLLLCQDIKGNLFLLQPNPEKPVILGSIKKALGDDVHGPVWTMPIIANGKLYLRFKQRLICFNIAG